MKELQTDYLDYYLLHSVGGGEGIKTFHDLFLYLSTDYQYSQR
jgi:uncharacterized protein